MNPEPPATRPLAPPIPFQPGDVIAGKYLFERVIGMGGMGIVIAARHLELDEPVAIKMLQPHLPAAGEPAARFLREARAAIKIKSDHVVRVLDVGRIDGGAPYIVMEFLEGHDLGQIVERSGRLPVADVVEYVMQACEAIAAAHALGIVHRDLKPANLFLAKAGDGSPCVKVLDFGISKVAGPPDSGQSSGLTSTATIMGTPCFMSPEQLRSTRDVDARADIWSIGAILHALLTGEPPYDGESNADVSAKIIRDAPTPLRVLRGDVPPALEAVVLRCLEKDPARRFPDVPSLAHALAEVSPHGPSRTSAQRVARIAAGAAPTMPSLPPPPDSPQAPYGMPQAPAAGPTRTASAWGDTRPEEKRGRRIAGYVAVAGIVVGAAVFGVLRLTGGHASGAGSTSAVGASAGAAPAMTMTTMPATAAPPGVGVGAGAGVSAGGGAGTGTGAGAGAGAGAGTGTGAGAGAGAGAGPGAGAGAGANTGAGATDVPGAAASARVPPLKLTPPRQGGAGARLGAGAAAAPPTATAPTSPPTPTKQGLFDGRE